MWLRAFVSFAIFVLSAIPAFAVTPLKATCADFLGAIHEDVFLFNGMILGIVAARTGYGDEQKTAFEAERVLGLTKKYCAAKPKTLFVKVIDLWSAYVSKYPYPDTGNN